jgi:phospholipid transport system substrate-binding protein
MIGVSRRIALLGALMMVGCGYAAAAESPRAVVEGFYGTLLETMKQAASLGFEGRYRKLEPAIERAYNLPLMTRLAVGPPWNTIAPPQQERLVQAFRRLTIATYASRFDGFDGERFEVRTESPAQSGGVLVESRLVLTKGDPVDLNYLLREADGRWQIIDVFLSGAISELATRRAEFGTVLRRDGPDGLIGMLERKVAELTPH